MIISEVIIMDKKLESRIARLEKLIKEDYQSYDIDEVSESIYNAIKGLVVRTKMHIDELKVEHRYDQIADWQDVLQDIRDLADKVNSIK